MLRGTKECPASFVVKCASLVKEVMLAELETYPKPGLVSFVDSGSHADMDADTFLANTEALVPFFKKLVIAGSMNEPLSALRAIGIEAEGAMLAATGGVNTHRGAIFTLGLLCAAAGARKAGLARRGENLGAIAARKWSGALAIPDEYRGDTHGQAAFRTYGVGGVRLEAAKGFPSVYTLGLPILRSKTHCAARCSMAARVECFFALLSHVADTNLLHRGGPDALRTARRLSQSFLDQGGTSSLGWLERAVAIHEEFKFHRWSPGGVADLLAATLLADLLEDGI